MCKKKFPELIIEHLFLVLHRKTDIFKRQPLHPACISLPDLQRDQSGKQFRNRMPCLFCKAVAVPGGAGGLIRISSACHDHLISQNLCSVRKPDSHSAAVLEEKSCRLSMQMYFHTRLAHPGLQCPDNIRGVVR